MPDLLAKKSSLEARYAELNQRLQAIQQDYARGLDADSEERAQELQNADVLAEIKRVTQEDLAKIAAELTQVTELLARS
jgi:hypothetical protein